MPVSQATTACGDRVRGGRHRCGGCSRRQQPAQCLRLHAEQLPAEARGHRPGLLDLRGIAVLLAVHVEHQWQARAGKQDVVQRGLVRVRGARDVRLRQACVE